MGHHQPQLKVYHNGAWVAANSATSTQVDVSATPPGGAGNGSLWWDSESGTMFVYYTDTDYLSGFLLLVMVVS